MTDVLLADPRTHKWWLVTRTGEHGHECIECRCAPGGPDHTKEATR